jgi:hypothetical protein
MDLQTARQKRDGFERARRAAQSRRRATLDQELRVASKEYSDACEHQARAQDRVDIAAAKLGAIQRLAAECFDLTDWWRWSSEHPGLAFAGLKLSDAVIRALQNRVCESAHAFITTEGGPDGDPDVAAMDGIETDDLIRLLREGGAVLGQSPLRELHAATINHPRVERTSTGYKLKGGVDRIIDLMRAVVDTDRVEEQQREADAEIAPVEPVEPF